METITSQLGKVQSTLEQRLGNGAQFQPQKQGKKRSWYRDSLTGKFATQNHWFRFGCCICLGPRLYMVSGICQHRICEDCLYLNGERRSCMKTCPLCGMDNAFPMSKPIIPQQVIEIQRYIGVMECPTGCQAQLWYWETEEHSKCCPLVKKSPKQEKPTTPRSRRSRVADRGSVNTLSRTPTASSKRITRSSFRQRSVRPRLGTS